MLAHYLVKFGGHQLPPCCVHPLHHYHLKKEDRLIIKSVLPRGFTQTVVRVLGRTLGESAAQVLGTLCYSWWPCNLLHTTQCRGKGWTTAQCARHYRNQPQLWSHLPDQETGSTLWALIGPQVLADHLALAPPPTERTARSVCHYCHSKSGPTLLYCPAGEQK